MLMTFHAVGGRHMDKEDICTKNVNYTKFFPPTSVSGKQHIYCNQHIKIGLKREFTVFYSQMPRSVIMYILQNWFLTE